MMSQHSNSAMAAIVVHNENLLRLCTKMATVLNYITKGLTVTMHWDSRVIVWIA